jgi:hypothetical protein
VADDTALKDLPQRVSCSNPPPHVARYKVRLVLGPGLALPRQGGQAGVVAAEGPGARLLVGPAWYNASSTDTTPNQERTAMPLFGAHMSVAGGLHNALLAAQKYDCPAVQIFT